nr:unnamed protein product [Callosobruchus analis]
MTLSIAKCSAFNIKPLHKIWAVANPYLNIDGQQLPPPRYPPHHLGAPRVSEAERRPAIRSTNAAQPRSLQGGSTISDEGRGASNTVNPSRPIQKLRVNCHKQYRTKSGLAKHLKTYGVRHRSKCQHCGVSFKTFAGVRAHEMSSHRELYYNELSGTQKPDSV